MALFNDGLINQQQDLANYENGILDVASAEQIDLDGKSALAQSEIGLQILALLLRRETRSPLLTWNCGQDTTRRQTGVNDVVVTDGLRQWHAMRTLAAVYRDAYNNQLNDRYMKKWQEYLKLEQDARDLLYETGIGLSTFWLPSPAAPVLTFVPGSGVSAQYFVQVTWVNQTGQESAPSQQSQLNTAPGTQLVITAPGNAPQYATGWNAYAGTSPGSMSLQNSTPLTLGAAWTMPGNLVTGQPSGAGQTPDRYVTDDHVLPRG
ncbi:MAG TPA: hypothetical protein VHD76_21295 [Bryobacteraceae bacterium]|jgi:hypothetical protein|nr:hypothetical protein [Bryobacteraceae bacterium]